MPSEADFAFCPHCGASRNPAHLLQYATAKPRRRQQPRQPSDPSRLSTAATLDVVAADADRRQVTVLFADVSGFTTLAERLDPEEVRAFQNALFETLGDAITRYDGFVEKFVGDAVMAVFGAPFAHEDDPERALDAALDMLERSAGLERDAGRRGSASACSCTSACTPARWSPAASAMRRGAAYAVTGDTVNTTARLLAAASGTVLVSDATHALTRHRFAFEPARQLALRGKVGADPRSSPDRRSRGARVWRAGSRPMASPAR